MYMPCRASERGGSRWVPFGHNLLVDARHLAAGLAERLQAVVPAGFHVEAQGGDVAVWSGTAPDLWCVIGLSSILDQDGDPTDHITAGCYSVLSTVQDEVAELTTEP